MPYEEGHVWSSICATASSVAIGPTRKLREDMFNFQGAERRADEAKAKEMSPCMSDPCSEVCACWALTRQTK